MTCLFFFKKKGTPFFGAKKLRDCVGAVGIFCQIWTSRKRVGPMFFLGGKQKIEETKHVCLREFLLPLEKNHYPGIKSPFVGNIMYIIKDIYVYMYR